MTNQSLSPIFLSHGAPTAALQPGPAGAFWQALGQELGKPKSVLCISAHWNTREPVLGAAEHPKTIHDFYGFPEQFYRLSYPAPGAPGLAQCARDILAQAGIPAMLDSEYGLDHGAWVPLKFLFPQADVPVAQLSVQPLRDARWHYRLGAALKPLRDEGVLILASGGATHNLRELNFHATAPADWAVAFDEWLADALKHGRREDLLDWETTAPDPHRAHPSPEHFLPLFVALGAAGEGAKGERLYKGMTVGSLSMDAYRLAA